MENIAIAAKNNLNVPIRLTITNVSGNYGGTNRILITIGQKGTALKDYYHICVDTDVLANNDWQEIGSIRIDTKAKVSFTNEQTQEEEKWQ